MRRPWPFVLVALAAAAVLWLALKGSPEPTGNVEIDDRSGPTAPPTPASLAESERGAGPRTPPSPGLAEGEGTSEGLRPPDDGAAITGVVLDDETGKPIAGAMVGVEDEAQECPRLPFALEGYLAPGDAWGNPMVRVTRVKEGEGERLVALDVSARTGEDGTFRLGWAKERRADLFARKAGWVLGCACGVSSGTPVELRLKKGLAITGVVVRPDLRPIAGATIRTAPPPGVPALPGRVESAVSDEEGKFTLAGLVPGAVVVLADHPKFMPTTLDPPVQPSALPLRIVLVPALLASFHLMADDGRTPENPTVAWKTDGSPPKSGLQLLRPAPVFQDEPIKDGDSAYQPVKVPCDAPDATFEVKADGYAPWRSDREQLPPDGGEKTFEVALLRDTSLGSLKIVLEDREGNALSFLKEKAEALPWRRDGKPIPAGIVIQPGDALVMPSLPAGAYGLLVRSPLHAPAVVATEVTAGGATEARVVLGPPAKLRVRFVAPEAGIVVRFRLLDGKELVYPYPENAKSAAPDGADESDPSGEPVLWAGAEGVVLTGLGTARYTVEVISTDLTAKATTVDTVEGETREVEIPVARR